MEGLILAIDTSGACCSAGIHDAETRKTLASVQPEIGRGHAEKLMAVIAEALQLAGCGYDDLAGIAVAVGPGSFTGLRVGLAAARGLALALDIPAVGVSTLESLAEAYFRRNLPVLAVIDAKRGEIYAAVYGCDGALFGGPLALPPESLATFLADCGLPPEGLIITAGSGAPIAERVLGRRVAESHADSRCDVAVVARLGAGVLRDAAADGRDIAAPRPLYLRGADAKPQSGGIVARLNMPTEFP